MKVKREEYTSSKFKMKQLLARPYTSKNISYLNSLENLGEFKTPQKSLYGATFAEGYLIRNPLSCFNPTEFRIPTGS